ncbi:uncharacterized protein [Rutidosis leptorrhynchoides]|uniref:uncharacterized protein n=1 Tax=Rutidosis leptorrhynchoides TaxID=125765 RepID=UPI003A99C056
MSLNIRGFAKDCKGESKVGWFRRVRIKENPDIVLIQESKCGPVDEKWVEMIWGAPNFNFIQKPKVGKSGGMLTIWDPCVFKVSEAVEKQNFLAIKGRWIGKQNESIVVNIYGPYKDGEKKMWDCLENLMSQSNDVEWVIRGDFNELRVQEERKNCQFIERRASWFNNFISSNRLIDIPMGDVSVVALDRNTLDHYPIILRDQNVDFGPKPFKLFDIWLDSLDVEKIIIDAWGKRVDNSKADIIFKDKLKNVKEALRN